MPLPFISTMNFLWASSPQTFAAVRPASFDTFMNCTNTNIRTRYAGMLISARAPQQHSLGLPGQEFLFTQISERRELPLFPLGLIAAALRLIDLRHLIVRQR